MASPRITAAIVHELNKRVTGNINAVIVKPNELQSAVHRPGFAAYYENADVVKQAASLAYGIIMGHPFMDGNKRTAFWAANEYLKCSGSATFTKQEANYANAVAVMDAIGEAHAKVAQNQMSSDELANVYVEALKK